MTSDLIFKHAAALLANAGFETPFELVPITGGGNNRVFLARQNHRIIGVIKQYYHNKDNLRDRLSSEYQFSKFLWDHNVRQIPKPIVSDQRHHLAFFSYIDGRKLSAQEITKKHIDQVIAFYHAINSFRTSAGAKMLPDASEACFSLRDHINLTENRVNRLKKIQGNSLIDKKAQQFIRDELEIQWKLVRDDTIKLAMEGDINPDKKITDPDKRLSPSDFGFHNALEDINGRLFFMDFEYAGWDDPAKTVCDFFCQPAVPVSHNFLPYLIKKIAGKSEESNIQRQRIGLLLPLYQVKWCCIVLNEFLPRGKSRRRFIDEAPDSEVIKERQLQKAIDIMENISKGS